MYVKYIEKGKEIESESITLKSIVEGIKYNKNEIEIYNGYLQIVPSLSMISFATKEDSDAFVNEFV